MSEPLLTVSGLGKRFGGFVALDVVQSIGSREGPWLANPILDAMADSFGWRR